MKVSDIILDSLDRVHELVPAILDGLSLDDVVWQPDEGSNSIGWLIWHLTRVEDDHMAGIGGLPQLWLPLWHSRFGLPYPPRAHGYGMTSADIAAFCVPSVKLLVDYADAVANQTRQIIATMKPTDFNRIVDSNYDPPVTAAVRLVSVMVETAQHIGQAGFVRGLRERKIGRESSWVGHV